MMLISQSEARPCFSRLSFAHVSFSNHDTKPSPPQIKGTGIPDDVSVTPIASIALFPLRLRIRTQRPVFHHRLSLRQLSYASDSSLYPRL
ncbi:hypothetical protein D9611_008347 [Ephemerocybe angulata]|uniref:Uncharacterized protein n=1 Tax=Ephemerocybe angulata TaxID=980116 RepID=A0A8H5BIR5_9AGAR|nr:hypothetical protein D9611_008347 [Tulosesus angulatus]